MSSLVVTTSSLIPVTVTVPPNSTFTLTPPDSPRDQPKSLPRAATAKDVALAKQRDREARLEEYGHWRLPKSIRDVNVDTKTNVTSVALTMLTEREKGIVSQDATGLVASIANGQYSSLEVTIAFCKTASAAQDLTNCLTEIFFTEAITRAKELDQHFAQTGSVIGPLHGLPVSIKDHILVKGQDTSTGYLAWAYNTVAEKDALVVELLRKAGAVLYVKTANPQTLLSLETENNIFGTTTNPFNRKLTPGGSSGGESALIACHGSPLGIGTDIGGSIRVPAGHCGIYGLKGSVGRFPHAGLLGSHDGMEAIIGALGPMARSGRDLGLWSKVMLGYEPWYAEPGLVNMPWKESVARGEGLPAKSRIAILWDDGVVAPHPPITDALKRTREALEKAGHEVIDWTPVGHQEAWDLIVKLYLLDGGEEYRETMESAGETGVTMTQWMLSHAAGRKPFGPRECFKLNAEREAFRTRLIQHWNATRSTGSNSSNSSSPSISSSGRPVDAILTPVFPSLAPLHGTTRWWGYSSYWNLLDYPGVVFPVGYLDSSRYLDVPLPHPPRNPTEHYIHQQWVPQAFQNAPISLQLIGRRHEEEKLLAVLSRVEAAISAAESES